MNTVWCMHTVSFPDSWLIWVESRIPVTCDLLQLQHWEVMCQSNMAQNATTHTQHLSHKRWSVAEPKLLWVFFHIYIVGFYLFIFFIYFQPLTFSFSYFPEWIFCFSDTIYILNINLFIFILVFWIHKIISVSCFSFPRRVFKKNQYSKYLDLNDRYFPPLLPSQMWLKFLLHIKDNYGR